MMAIVVRGDALVPGDVSAAFDQIEDVDAVVSTIGGTPADPSADSEGNINLIKAAIKKGVKRFVLVTSIGTGDSKDAPPQQVRVERGQEHCSLKTMLIEPPTTA